MFHSIYELKERMEGVKLRWAIPWTFAQTWNRSQILCSPGWCYMGYLFLWIPLQVPAVEAVCICVALFPLCGLCELICHLSMQPGIRAGWVRGVQTDGCQQGCYQWTCLRKRRRRPCPEILWNLCRKFSGKTNCPHAPLSCCWFGKH